MLYVCTPTRQRLTAMVVRPFHRKELPIKYLADLRHYGIELINSSDPESARLAINAGCRVGLLILTDENDFYFLDECEPLLQMQNISWVGLIAQELISVPRVHEIIDEYLFNFITTPADLDHILLTIRHAWGMAFIRELQSRPASSHYSVEADILMRGKTTQMQKLFTDIKMIARVDSPLLITGPAGGGKELAALSIHRQSDRKNGPFAIFNCIDAEQSLAQVGLFSGEKEGISTRIKSAEGGTLFFSHIETLSPIAQQELLHFLLKKNSPRENAEGSTTEIGVRIIAATEKDLAMIVQEGRFNQELYFCLSALTITIPKLANRLQDIEDLSRYFFNQYALEHKKNVRGFSSAAMDKLRQHTWPNNVQELKNRIQRAVVLTRGRFIQPEDLGFEINSPNDILLSHMSPQWTQEINH